MGASTSFVSPKPSTSLSFEQNYDVAEPIDYCEPIYRLNEPHEQVELSKLVFRLRFDYIEESLE